MYRYSGFGLTIDSELELPELPPAQSDADLTIRLGHVSLDDRLATLTEEATYNTLAGGFHLRNGNEIVVDPIPNVDPATVRLVLLGRIMAFFLRQRGWVSLHASGVLVNNEAVLFAGPSGSGKSTMAAAFHARGHAVVTDDIAAVRVRDGVCVVAPARPRLRLKDDTRTLIDGMEHRVEFQIDKHTIDLAPSEWPEVLPVKRIYLLEEGLNCVEKVPVPEAVASLSFNSFIKRRRMTREALQVHIAGCASVAGATSIHRLVRHLVLDRIPSVVRLVEDDLLVGILR